MAVQFSAISNLWTDATWQTVDATSYLKSEAATTNTTTSYVASQTFTTGAITVEGILLRVQNTSTTPTGTFSVELYNSTGAVSVATVTCNVTDITPNNQNYAGGWAYFKFSTPQLLLAATAYSIRIKSSVASEVTVYRNATAGNWSRGLVTSTTAALAANDDVIIAGNITAASATTVNTVTFNYTGANSYGSFEVGAYGKVVGENAVSTNYAFAINSGGLFRIAHNGIVEFSTSSARLPASSTFIINLTNTTAGVNGIENRNFGTFRAYGALKTRKCKLAADAAAAATVLTTDVSTSWLANDEIAIAGTEGFTQSLQKTLSINASGTTVTLSSGLANATKGTSPTQADVINLTSNFKIYGSSQALCGYTVTRERSIFDIDNIEFKFMGNASTTGGVTVYTLSTGSCSVKDCTFWMLNQLAVITQVGADGYTIDGIYIYNVNGSNSSAVSIGATLNNITSTVKNAYIINAVAYGIGFGASSNLVIDNITVANIGSLGGISFQNLGLTVGAASNLTAYRCASPGVTIRSSSQATVSRNITFTNVTCWRNSYGIAPTQNSAKLTFDTFTLFGNTSANIAIHNCNNIKFINGSVQGGVTTVAPYGIINYSTTFPGYKNNIFFERCSFGTVTGHTSGDILADNHSTFYYFNNCTMSSSTLIVTQIALVDPSKITFQRFGGVAGTHRTYKGFGTIVSDSVIFDSTPRSLRLTPNIASYKLETTPFQVAVASGGTVIITVKVRKSVIGDGTAYNGNQPRLMLKANPSAGSSYNSDIVCATATAASDGAWETLSYTLPTAVTDNVGMEFYVDCDGTTGWVNVDTFVSNNNNSMTYYMNGEPMQDIASSGALETAYTFIT